MKWTERAERPPWWGELAADLRIAIRSLLRNRTFSVITILTLAVGIGANTAIFSVVEGVMLRPLPYPNADRLVRVATAAAPRTGLVEIPFSAAGFSHFAEHNRSFEAFGGYLESGTRWRVPLLGDGPPQEVVRTSIQVSALEVLGVAPEVGRLPTREEDLMDPVAPVVLLSHDLWSSRFGSDPSVVGRTITLRDWSAEVIGVMPRGFDFPSPEVDVWTLGRLRTGSPDVAEHSWGAIARLAPGVTIEEATADAERLIAGFDALAYSPERREGMFSGRAIVRPLLDEVVGEARLPLLIALASAGFVLLIVCTNVMSLMLVRSESKSREHSVRLALGSGRGRLIRYIMTEVGLLTAVGTVVGVGLAIVGTHVLVSMGPANLPRLDEVRIDSTVFVFTIVTSLLVGVLAGLLPAVRASGNKALPSLRAGGSGTSNGRGRNRALSGLVVAQMAVALVLLVGSGLMVRTFQRLHDVDPGFDADGVLTFRLTPPSVARYRGDAGVDFSQFVFPLRERIAGLPGVISVGATSSLPLTGVVGEPGGTLGPVEVEEFPAQEGGLRPNFLTKRSTPGYFEAMGIPILEGRGFVDSDFSADYSRTAFIISASVKRRYWPNESAIGKGLKWGRLEGPVVGVAGEVHHRSLGLPPDEIIYSAQIGNDLMVAVRAAGDVDLLVPAIRQLVAEIDPEVQVTRAHSLNGILGESLSRTSFVMTLLALAAAIALTLAGVGVYGVLSFVTRLQTKEIGVRMALGADPTRVWGIVIRRGLTLTALGALLGLAASVPLGRALDSLLYEVSPLDLPSQIGACSALVGIAVVSSFIPAVRAARTEPAVALTAEG